MQIGDGASVGSIRVYHGVLFIVEFVFLGAIHVPKSKVACSVACTCQNLAAGGVKSMITMNITFFVNDKKDGFCLHAAIDTIRCHLDSSPFMPDLKSFKLVTQGRLCLHILFTGLTWRGARIGHLTQDREKLLLLIVIESINAFHLFL